MSTVVVGAEYNDDNGDYEEPDEFDEHEVDLKAQKKLMKFSIQQLQMRIKGYDKAIENPEVAAIRQKEAKPVETKWEEDEDEFQVQKAK